MFLPVYFDSSKKVGKQILKEIFLASSFGVREKSLTTLRFSGNIINLIFFNTGLAFLFNSLKTYDLPNAMMYRTCPKICCFLHTHIGQVCYIIVFGRLLLELSSITKKGLLRGGLKGLTNRQLCLKLEPLCNSYRFQDPNGEYETPCI